MIYADNSATTSLDPEALSAMEPFLKSEFGNASGAYSFSRRPRQALREAREIIAECIGARGSEVFFTSGGTESANWAIKGAALARKSERRQVVTSRVEHHAVLRSCQFLEAMGFEAAYLPVDGNGLVAPEVLAGAVSGKTALVSLILANNEIGSLQDIPSLAEIGRKVGAMFHTDAVQAVGHIPVDVNDLGVDLLSASAHKFNGPKGSGFLYVREGLKLCPYMSGGGQEGGGRAGTENVAGIVGMAAALKSNVEAMEKNRASLDEISRIFLTRLESHGVDFILTGSKNRLPGHVSISIRNEHGDRILHRLDLKGICISTGSACNASETEVSHVIEALNLPPEYAMGAIRVSFGKCNSTEDAVEIADEIASICKPAMKLVARH